MTAAVCLKCGVMKFGAWTPCPECRYSPETEEEREKSILASDHNLSNSELRAVSRMVMAGRKINFVSERGKLVVEDIDQVKESLKDRILFAWRQGKLRRGLGCLAIYIVIIILLIWGKKIW
ncbi:hypothetical protein [Roseimicrobium sp. ORNL1]|uniref:hypothetical protein n=1 Tax=Roseimicrobium sp. ORNL1 TaxID=2711231 RepID=UPI0013E1C6A4|nr:hypothetical protein [Roseimicrobium sp. ORNL1]QIF03535.1 hypothetical protein G5S37_19060 [Roseimicrobium sp. ORNL1]